jgi:dTDP-4-dehydrorhamnose 3,5-epimerase
MPYKVTPTNLDGVLVLEPTVHGDARGFFLESFNQRDFLNATGIDTQFVQDNHSRSSKGVLRGLHYQVGQTQGKLVRVSKGEVFDVSVNLVRGHPQFGKWTGVLLSEENQRQVWIPPGFAHGFVVLRDMTDFLYKTTGYYSQDHERGLLWSDPEIGIDWPINFEPTLTEKDRLASSLEKADTFDADEITTQR